MYRVVFSSISIYENKLINLNGVDNPQMYGCSYQLQLYTVYMHTNDLVFIQVQCEFKSHDLCKDVVNCNQSN